ncbi:MAG: cobyrinate a,c-diamide synthase [Synechococcaceae cyanobacterium]
MACLIAAPCSGSGKTLLSLCLSALAHERGLVLQPFKVGPDYLDPQLLAAVAGRPCRNLDTLLCGPEWVRRSFRWHGSRAQQVLVEGVMGLFDGRGPSSDGSSADVAALLDLPVVLVVEASRQAGSLAALVRGFRDHGPPAVRLAGVVLNRVGSERHRALLGEALETIAVPLLGVLPHHAALDLPSRHLGLLPPQELADLGERRRLWAHLAERHLDLARLEPLLAPPEAEAGSPDPIHWSLAQAAPEPAGLGGGHPGGNQGGPQGGPPREPPLAGPRALASAPATGDDAQGGDRALEAGAASAAAGASDRQPPLTVAIASDRAFHFRYPEAEELLRAVGLAAQAWSPLADEPLPPGCRAVILPGGYPELHAAQLAASRRSLGDLVAAAAAGLPLLAECGGLLLLGQQLHDTPDHPQPMAGLLPFRARRGSLSLGYRQALAIADGLLVRRGEILMGHEFHRWQLLGPEANGEAGPELGPGGSPEGDALGARADVGVEDSSTALSADPFAEALRGPGLMAAAGRAAAGEPGRPDPAWGEPIRRDGGAAAIQRNEPMTATRWLWQLEGWGSPRRTEGWTTTHIHATWLHLHWAGYPAIPWRLAAASANVAPLPRNAASCFPRSPGRRT